MAIWPATCGDESPDTRYRETRVRVVGEVGMGLSMGGRECWYEGGIKGVAFVGSIRCMTFHSLRKPVDHTGIQRREAEVQGGLL